MKTDNLHTRIYAELEAQDALREREQNWQLAKMVAATFAVIGVFTLAFQLLIWLVLG